MQIIARIATALNKASIKFTSISATETGLITIDRVSYQLDIPEGVDTHEWLNNGRKNWRAIKSLVLEVWTPEPVEPEADADPLDRIREQLKEMERAASREERIITEAKAYAKRHPGMHLMQAIGIMTQRFAIADIIGEPTKRAYRDWMKENHPDTNPEGDLSIVQAVNAARAALRRTGHDLE